VKPGAGGEIQLTDAMIALVRDQLFHAMEYKGTTYDCGNRLGFVLANLAFGLSRPEMSDALRVAMICMLNDHMRATHQGKAPFALERLVA
jgi:UTP--glucose-1-phosphate uridylyltransferase